MATGDVYLTAAQLEAGLDAIRRAPQDGGVLRLIVRRPQTLAREVVDGGVLDLTLGLLGDNWLARGNRHTGDGRADPKAQLTVMNSRAIELIAREPTRWALAGDQLYVDLDISTSNLPAGSRLAIGQAVIEVSDAPHTGCKQFAERFGVEAVKFVNSPVGKELRLRGLNARVVTPGAIRTGDLARKVAR